jgi:hypothetical protein
MLKYRQLALLLIVATVGIGTAAYSQQHSRQQIQPPPKIEPAPQPQQQGSTETRGTDQNPVSVKIISTPDTKAETPEERERRMAHETNEQGLTDFTRALVEVTAALAIIAFIQAGLFVWQLGYMRAGVRDANIAAIAARNNAETAKTAMIASQRAYVHYGGCRWISHKDINDGHIFWRMRPQWVNRGNTPTRQLRVYVHYEFRDSELPPDYPFTQDATIMLHPATIAPSMSIESGFRDIAGKDLVAVSKQEKFYYIWGVARYRGVFSDTPEYVTKFCVQATAIMGNPMKLWNAQNNAVEVMFTSHPRHNCSDEDCDE